MQKTEHGTVSPKDLCSDGELKKFREDTIDFMRYLLPNIDKIWIYVPNLLFQRRHRRQFLIDYVPEDQKTIRGKYYENLLIHSIFKMYYYKT